MLSCRATRRIPCLVAATAVALGMLMPLSAHADGTQVTGGDPGTVAPPPAPAPVTAKVKVKTTEVPAVTPESSSSDVVAELPETSTAKFRMVGVTWSRGGQASDVTVKVRTRTAGEWSSWTSLGVDDDDEGGDPGTDPLWVGAADGVAARVTSTSGTPEGVHITTIDPGDAAGAATDSAATASRAAFSGALDAVARATTVATTDGAPGYTPKPTIISRASWGASAGTPCDSPASGDHTMGVVVHHTAGSNSYTKSESRAIVRGIQAYHVKARKWCDIGYNFLVDKYGQIFEGRRGGEDRAVRAAHSGNLAVNTYTMGVSMMGNYDVIKPQAALKDAMVKLIGWRMGTNYLKAKGTYKLDGLTLNMIAGHRNVIHTECPGRYGYAWLSEKGGLRDRVEAYMSRYSTPVKKLYTSLGAAKTGPIFVGESKSSAGSRLRTKLTDIYSKGSSTAARYTSGSIRTEHSRVGGRSGALGYPTSDAAAVAGGKRQTFDGGAIYALTGKSTAFSLLGGIAATYQSLGATAGRLGVPTSSTKTVTTGVTRVNFAKGYIISTKATRTTVAYSSAGAVLATKTDGASTPAGGRPATVTGVTVKAGSHSARVSWPAVSGATSYDACVLSTATASSCARWIGGTKAVSVLVSDLVRKVGSTDYFVKVRAKNGAGAGKWSALKGFDLTSATPSSGTSVTVPSSGRITVRGHGYGHGIGMGQYGAQNAAGQGVTYDKILARYYPGTALGSRTGNIRVLISQDTTDAVTVAGKAGLVFRDIAAKKTLTLPTSVNGAAVKQWRIIQVTSAPTRSKLQYKSTGGFVGYRSMSWTGDAQFEGPSQIGLVMPTGATVKYRGALKSALPSKGATSRNTVNVLPIEYYVRGVIAAEMPSTWRTEALKAQAVAARTYGVRSITTSRYYDICSTTACQVYGGAARETAATDAAARATSGKIVTYKGSPAFTQFSSSSGGYTAAGSQPYLKAVPDPYDNWSGNANHAWTTTVTAATIQKAYPSIGKLAKIKILARSGQGEWGGRVSKVSLVGTKKTVTISGDDARWSFGLKSNWFRF